MSGGNEELIPNHILDAEDFVDGILSPILIDGQFLLYYGRIGLMIQRIQGMRGLVHEDLHYLHVV